MTCDECDKVQNSMEYVSFVRVGKANVMIVGCKEHLKDLLDIYNLGLMTRAVVNETEGGLI